MSFSSNPPLSLYIHFPWCEKKCPYCDFNSHLSDSQDGSIPEQAYIETLLQDLQQDLPLIWGRSIESIFMGGGTPSLFSGEAIDFLLSQLRALLRLKPDIEITLESNPGSADSDKFAAYKTAGVNRLSIGVQSFNDDQLNQLGRIHNAEVARQAFAKARDAGFDNINLDLMYGLPGQSLEQAQADLQQAIDLQPEHISHYQLTIETNTSFFHQPPDNMPDDDLSWQIQQECQKQLGLNNFVQYEVSAYSLKNKQCQHNLNYWHFGDYLGIGAGAHGKITQGGQNQVLRRNRQRQPKAYLQNIDSRITSERILQPTDLIFEFMLNALRLTEGFLINDFIQNTGLNLSSILPTLNLAIDKGFLKMNSQKVWPTYLGLQFNNDLQELFLNVKSENIKPFFSA